MKNLLSTFALSFTLLLGACGGSNDMADSEAISAGEVPLSVISAFDNKYPDAMNVTWGKQTQGNVVEYKAAFMEDGKQKHAEYREREGVVIED
jgi:major membrane immunogen (membrane-anchored lipoprotein)